MDKITNLFTEKLAETRKFLPGSNLGWLNLSRDAGIQDFSRSGMPTQRWESWKYTRLPDISKDSFRCIEKQDGEKEVVSVPSLFKLADLEAKLVFVNGFLRSDLSKLEKLSDGVRIGTVVDMLQSDPSFVQKHLPKTSKEKVSPLVSLNAAFWETGIVLHVRPGLKLKKPIEIVHLSGMTNKPLMRHSRNIMIIESGSEATIIEHHGGLSAGKYLTNAVTDIELSNSATMRHYTIQAESRDSVHLATSNVNVGKDGKYHSFGLSMGAALSRCETNLRLIGQGAGCGVSGVYMMRGREHCDNTTVIEHIAANTTSREVFKGVLDDEARGVFQGRIIVHKNAQKTDGYQLSKALLISDGAEMNAKPELEIYADDVKCSHGATTGQLDQVALFYLRSRGIPEALARNLLIQSFLAEALDEVGDLEVRDAMLNHVIHWLPAHCYLADEWKDS